MMNDEEVANRVIGAAINVHKALGPGLLESAYRECLFYELQQNDLFVEKEKSMPIIYREIRLECGYRMDLLVERRVIVELKAVEALNEVHLAQTLTYLKFGGYRLGLLINFHVSMLKQGIRRVIR